MIGKDDAVLLADPTGKIVLSINRYKKRIPASTLKIFTALLALHHFGPDYRFQTGFYLDSQGNLKIKGYGDPLLISEVVAQVAATLSKKLNSVEINDIWLDDTYFEQPLVIPGVSSSRQPYDAPNGALCVNFNTINFKTDGRGVLISAEPQTPLLPFALQRVRKTGLKRGRVVLSHNEDALTLYAGHLFRHFLEQEGVRFAGTIRKGTVDPHRDTLLYDYISIYSLSDIISKLLEFSNNFSTNQLLIAAGAKVYGPPGNLDKGVRAAKAYAKEVLQIDGMNIYEGSGISRKNRISADEMIKVLIRFRPYRHLMQKKDHTYYKTGTLMGIRTRVGYIEGPADELFSFVVLINTPGKSAEKVVQALHRAVGG